MDDAFHDATDGPRLGTALARNPWLVRSARAVLGWSQDRLASASGVSRKSVNEHEGSARATASGATMALAEALAGADVRFVPVPGGSFVVGAVGDRQEILAAALDGLAAVPALPSDVEAGIPWGFVLRVHAVDGSWSRIACWPAGTTLAEMVSTPSGRTLAVTVGNLRVRPEDVVPESFSGQPATLVVGPAGHPHCLVETLCQARRKDRRVLSKMPFIVN